MCPFSTQKCTYGHSQIKKISGGNTPGPPKREGRPYSAPTPSRLRSCAVAAWLIVVLQPLKIRPLFRTLLQKSAPPKKNVCPFKILDPPQRRRCCIYKISDVKQLVKFTVLRPDYVWLYCRPCNHWLNQFEEIGLLLPRGWSIQFLMTSSHYMKILSSVIVTHWHFKFQYKFYLLLYAFYVKKRSVSYRVKK